MQLKSQFLKWYLDSKKTRVYVQIKFLKHVSVWFLPDFVVMGWQLLQQLLDSVFLPNRVDVGNLVFGQSGKVEVDLENISKGEINDLIANEVHSCISPEQIITATVVISPLLYASFQHCCKSIGIVIGTGV